MQHPRRHPQRGQVMALFALALTALVLGVGIVVDGGFAFAQRRVAQNAADFAAMAGTRIVGLDKTGRPALATDVTDAIDSVLEANDAELVSAQYVDAAGNALGHVVGRQQHPRARLRGGGGGADRLATVPARGHRRDRLGRLPRGPRPRHQATASAVGSCRSGSRTTVYDDLDRCQLRDLTPCINQHLTSGRIIDPGDFGWLAFGLGEKDNDKCDWDDSLGMVPSGCEIVQDLPRLPDRAAAGLARLLHRGRPGRRGQDRRPDRQRVGRPQLLHQRPGPRVGSHLERDGAQGRRKRLLPHRRLRGHHLHRRRRARQVAQGRGHREHVQAGNGSAGLELLHRARWDLHRRCDRSRPARSLASGVDRIGRTRPARLLWNVWRPERYRLERGSSYRWHWPDALTAGLQSRFRGFGVASGCRLAACPPEER